MYFPVLHDVHWDAPWTPWTPTQVLSTQAVQAPAAPQVQALQSGGQSTQVLVPASASWQFAEPCSDQIPCNASLTCDSQLMQCVRRPKLGEACSSGRPCSAGMSCHPGVNRCFNEPRKGGDPCLKPGGGEVACEPGLVCDATTTGRCVQPAEARGVTWPGRPCRDAANKVNVIGQCASVPRGSQEYCTSHAQCGTGLQCHPLRKVCVLFSAEGQPCLKAPSGEELQCIAPWLCVPGVQKCYHLPGDERDYCVESGNVSWPCRTGLRCRPHFPYCSLDLTSP
ncbi:hypothetical protein Rsub_06907 [Raphidocelis subcapitata]|uniref:Uncharacterized protein n=1 Tax=Raphidocelis subcapitata TaxID=307507 RepID=A0A2V0PB10_9CHLO|nr:hypothetical protein Rsub_06907 [Raphidocelis subcapitata]|eukprot:GBF94285.1 hypothetical protein Rsub_06907 [Raphidocelis subcapitata]